MKKRKGNLQSFLRSAFSVVAILFAFAVSVYLYVNVMGNPVNFEGGNPEGHPLPGNYLGIIYKGGWVVPVLITCVMLSLIFGVERIITLGRAKGRKSLNNFVFRLQNLLAEDKIEEAIEACNKQRGSLANVVHAGLIRYRDLQKDKTLSNDQKIESIEKSLEEATALEVPMLSRNMVIFSSLASLSVLIGLFGTVLGMIRAFAALAQAGAPDALALSTGISEALINTATGILGSVLAILGYNYFSSMIDSYAYKIDEASFSLVETFTESLKEGS
jgi:biopolymer transport protein ExbB